MAGRSHAPEFPLSAGEFVDPNRGIEVAHARQRFCEAINRVAPACVEDLYRLLPLVAPLRGQMGSQEDTLIITRALTAWVQRWHIDAVWMFAAGFQSVLAVSDISERTGTEIPKRIYGFPMVAPQFSLSLSLELESLNPGWADNIFSFEIPPVQVVWHPTRERRDDVKQSVLSAIEKFIDEAFDDVEAEMREIGSAEPAGPISERWFEWAVHRTVLGKSYNQMEQEGLGTRPAVRKAMKRLQPLIGLPISD